MDDRWQARVTVCIALILYSASVVFLALSGDGHIWGDAVCVVLAIVSIIGLIAYALPQIKLPGERYAYLVTGYCGFTTLLMYLISTSDDHARRLATVLVLLTGVVGAYGAYLNQYDELDET